MTDYQYLKGQVNQHEKQQNGIICQNRALVHLHDPENVIKTNISTEKNQDQEGLIMFAQSVLKTCKDESLDHAPVAKLLKIIELCEIEIRKDEAMKSGGITEKQRYTEALKYIKEIEDYRPALKGAWFENGLQCFCNGITGILLSKHIEGIPEPGKEYERMKLTSIFESNKDELTEIYLNLSDISAHAKINGKYAGSKNNHYIIQDRWFNHGLILQAVKILGGDIKAFFAGSKPMNPMFLESENGRAIILPLRQ